MAEALAKKRKLGYENIAGYSPSLPGKPIQSLREVEINQKEDPIDSDDICPHCLERLMLAHDREQTEICAECGHVVYMDAWLET